MPAALERRFLQLAVFVAALVPIGAGVWGVLGGFDSGVSLSSGHARYLSGLLLGIGLTFWWIIPTIERRGEVVRALAAIVVIGGLARLWLAISQDAWRLANAAPLAMELIVTPLIALWRERVDRRL